MWVTFSEALRKLSIFLNQFAVIICCFLFNSSISPLREVSRLRAVISKPTFRSWFCGRRLLRLSEKDKNISAITYNFLNLPNQVTQTTGNTSYVYRADGTKLKKTYNNVTTDYLDGFQYQNGALQFFPTSEGYYDWSNKRYVYNYADHLGNVRISYYKGTNGGAVVDKESNYYPFGLEQTGYGYTGLVGNTSYNYKYNGKELQETGMYDYGARLYMPDIGRWGVVDPLAEKYPSWSPYNYCLNNPVKLVDPDGRKPLDIIIKGANNSSFTIKTSLVNTSINLSDYGFSHDFGGNYSFGLQDATPDAIGIDLNLSGGMFIGGTVGLNLLWHTRGSDVGIKPEVHLYEGLSGGTSVAGGASIGIIVAWATQSNGTHSSDSFVANGVNWTGTFYSASVAAGSITGSYFTSDNPFDKSSDNNKWSGIQVNYSPTSLQMPNMKDVKSLFDLPSKDLNYSKSNYYMLYGNGGDVLNFNTNTTKDDINVNGWHWWNPIDPSDNKK